MAIEVFTVLPIFTNLIWLIFNFYRYLSVTGFVTNIDTLTLMIPELLQSQCYVVRSPVGFLRGTLAQWRPRMRRSPCRLMSLTLPPLHLRVRFELEEQRRPDDSIRRYCQGDPLSRMLHSTNHKHFISSSSMRRFPCQPPWSGPTDSEDVFNLCDHIIKTQDGIDNHHFCILSLVVSLFHKLRQYHISTLRTLQWQCGSLRKKLCKSILFQGCESLQQKVFTSTRWWGTELVRKLLWLLPSCSWAQLFYVYIWLHGMSAQFKWSVKWSNGSGNGIILLNLYWFCQ